MEPNLDALDALYPLPPEELSRQWVLSRRHELLPEQWSGSDLHGWHLAAHPDANVCRLENRHGELMGWVIEPLAYLEGERRHTTPGPTVRLPLEREPSGEELDRVFYGRDPQGVTNGDGFVGGWTAIVLSPSGQQWVYLGATHSVVYSPQHEAVATSHNLIPGLIRDRALSKAFDPMGTHRYYTFGLTPFLGLHRLLPNHCLNLSGFTAHRHWPRGALDERVPGPTAAARIIKHARELMSVMAESYDIFRVPLSAGRDSRAVLSCLRPFVDDERVTIQTFTTSGPSLASRVDGQIGVRLAKIAQVPHELKAYVKLPTQPEDLRRAFVKLGESKFGPALGAPAREQSPPPVSQLNLPGMAGETARAFYWTRSRPRAQDIEPGALADCTRSPKTDTVMAAVTRWRDELPEGLCRSPADVLDLAYIEQRMGCWEASSRYLFPGPGRANISLMGTTLSLETILRMPEDYRAAGLLQEDMVAYGWPELLPLPFNKPVGLLRLRSAFYRLRTSPRASLAAMRAARAQARDLRYGVRPTPNLD